MAWPYASQLIHDQRYDQLEQFLRQIESRAADKNKKDAVVLGIVQAALTLNHSCRECSGRAAAFWSAYEEANQQHQALVASLTEIVKTVLEYTDDSSIKLPPPPPGLTLAPHDKLALLQRLWQSIQNFFIPLEPALSIAFLPDNGHLRPPLTSKPPVSQAATPTARKSAPQLALYCLGPFRVYYDGQPIENWSGRKCKSVLKYLVSAQRRSVAKEVLMELFWPESDPDAARNNLNVTIYGLRQALRQANDTVSYILYQDDCYLLHPDLAIWVDSEVFSSHVARGKQLELAGDREGAIREFSAAEALYQGEFMEDDRYEEWVISHRQRFQDQYLTVLNRLSEYHMQQDDLTAAIAVCRKILAIDGCHEHAHRDLMACYRKQGQNHLALRQYHLCTETLNSELSVFPSAETTELYRQIRSALNGRRT